MGKSLYVIGVPHGYFYGKDSDEENLRLLCLSKFYALTKKQTPKQMICGEHLYRLVRVTKAKRKKGKGK